MLEAWIVKPLFQRRGAWHPRRVFGSLRCITGHFLAIIVAFCSLIFDIIYAVSQLNVFWGGALVCNSGLHCWRHPQCLVNSAEIIVHGINRNHVFMIFNLLGKCVGQAGKAPVGQPEGGHPLRRAVPVR
jgi:hypothetical protein